ncbi:MAG TPA: hypothetical protein DCZ94_01300 [Lentisphaeria bacterium]|nr:MAG: hypothetical protein A2X48_11480 [Lentisphaerae bacterium GWF2_49_21]HBC85567.1 hypothetical protein [Lentisphaeria bacterium]
MNGWVEGWDKEKIFMNLSKDEEKWLAEIKPMSSAKRITLLVLGILAILLQLYYLSKHGYIYELPNGKGLLTEDFISLIAILFLFSLCYTLIFKSPRDKLIIALANKIKDLPETNPNKPASGNSAPRDS